MEKNYNKQDYLEVKDLAQKIAESMRKISKYPRVVEREKELNRKYGRITLENLYTPSNL